MRRRSKANVDSLTSTMSKTVVGLLGVVPPAIDLRDWVHDYVYRHHHQTYPVVSEGHLEGLIDMRVLNRIPPDEWRQHTVGEVMRHDLDRYSIGPDADALQALSQMQRTGSSRLLVTEGDRLVGIVSLKDLLRFLHLKLELEGPGDEEQNRPPTSPPQDAERPDHMIHT